MEDYLAWLIESFEAHADAENAGPMKRYMRDQFEYLGIKTPQRKELVKNFFHTHGLPPVEALPALALELWQLPYREYQYVAIGFLDRRKRYLTPDHLPLLEWLITTKSWWDTVDGLAANQVSGVLARFPEARDGAIGRWRREENIWLRRTTLLFQLRYKEKTDAELLYALIRENLEDREFFIQKAIGWSLREYSKTDPAAVQQFVAATALSGLARREGLKWMKNKGMIA